MLSEISVSGYKSLQNSAVRLSPLTVIVGRNNTGKSNLFDALHLLSHLAGMPVASAFKPELHRGDPVESFFSEQIPLLRIKCELDLRRAPHPFDSTDFLTHPFLCYEIEISFRDGRLQIESESLTGKSKENRNPRKFIGPGRDGKSLVSLHRDQAAGGKARQFPLPTTRSVLHMIDDAEHYPHVVALARSLSSWRFFHFEPDVLREPSPAMNILELEPNGWGLSGFYDTLEHSDPARFQSAERALRRGIPEARKIKVLDTGDRRRLLAIERDDGREFVARVLSDGTLRFLALLALAYSPLPPGLICFEEPENGVHPGRLMFIVDLLRGMSERGAEEGDRSQVIVNSHSPYLVDLLSPPEMRIASLNGRGQTHFTSVEDDLFSSKPALKRILESGEQTLGELWSQGSLDAIA